MQTSTEQVLFLSGAGLPAWIWDGARRRLAACDTRAAPRPAGRGAAPPMTTTRLRDYAEAAVGAVPQGRFAIVAHSSGGVVGTEIARIAPERVTAVLGVCAVVPAPGGSFLSSLPVPARWVLGTVIRAAGTRPPDSAIRRTLAHGLPADVVERLIADIEPEAPGLYRDRTGHASWDGTRGYLHTTRDRELSAALQRRCARRLGATWEEWLGTGHLPMVEDPGVVADAISRFLVPGCESVGPG